MTREDTKIDSLIFPMASEGLAATQCGVQTVHMLLSDDRLGDRGTPKLEVRNGRCEYAPWRTRMSSLRSTGSQSPRGGGSVHAGVLREPGRADSGTPQSCTGRNGRKRRANGKQRRRSWTYRATEGT